MVTDISLTFNTLQYSKVDCRMFSSTMVKGRWPNFQILRLFKAYFHNIFFEVGEENVPKFRYFIAFQNQFFRIFFNHGEGYVPIFLQFAEIVHHPKFSSATVKKMCLNYYFSIFLFQGKLFSQFLQPW